MSHRHVTKGASSSTVTDSATQPAIDAAIKAHVAAMHTPIVIPPQPIPVPPVTGIPALPAGGRWSWNAAAGLLAPFRSLTIPSDKNHLSVADGGTAAATDPMAKYNRYGDNSTTPPTPLHVPVIANGYLRELGTRRADGLYASTFIGTSMDGRGGAATHSLRTGKIRFAFRMNVGYVTWQTPLWLIGWVGDWNGDEVDICEVINGQLTFNLHGSFGSRQVASITPPADLATVFHTAGVDLSATGGTFYFDDKPVGSWTGGGNHDLAYVSDTKVGIPWESKGPTAATPDPTLVDLAWIWEGA